MKIDKKEKEIRNCKWRRELQTTNENEAGREMVKEKEAGRKRLQE